MFLFPAIALTMVVVAPAENTVAAAPSAARVRESIERSLDFSQKSSQHWKDGFNQPGTADGHPIFIKTKVQSCASCHHLPMTFWCQTEAKNHGIAVDQKSLDYFREWSLQTYTDDPELKPVAQDKFGKSLLSLNTIYLSLAAEAEPSPDEATRDALKKFAAHIIEKQESDGSWKAGRTGYEPPIGDITEVLTMQALLALAEAKDHELVGDRWPQARDRAMQWLQKNEPSDRHQSLAMRLLLSRRFGKPEETQSLVKQLLDRQNADGGWSQMKDLPSDAMATGQSLYVIDEVGAGSENKSAVSNAQAFL